MSRIVLLVNLYHGGGKLITCSFVVHFSVAIQTILQESIYSAHQGTIYFALNIRGNSMIKHFIISSQINDYGTMLFKFN